MLGYLRLLVNSRDELALARIIDIPHRGLDHRAFTDIKHEAKRRGLSMYQVSTNLVFSQQAFIVKQQLYTVSQKLFSLLNCQ